MQTYYSLFVPVKLGSLVFCFNHTKQDFDLLATHTNTTQKKGRSKEEQATTPTMLIHVS
jgi:hypothetical protein